MKLAQFDELSPQRPQPSTPRLKPNIFARIVRFSWRNAAWVLAFWLLFSGLGILLAFWFGRLPDQTRLPLPTSSTSTQSAPAEFADLANLQTISLSNADAEVLAVQRADMVAALREHNDIYELVFAPGAHDFYDDYGMLFRPLDEIKTRVAYALSLKPLFDAIAEAPNAQSMTTLVGEIAGAAQQGRSSPGVVDLLNEAAGAVQALANGEDKPLDWSKVAELNVPSNSTSVTILALPKLGQESAAHSATSKLLDVLRDSSATKTQLVQAATSQEKLLVKPENTLRTGAATLIGVAFAGLLMAFFVGQIRLLLLIFAPSILLLVPLIAFVMLIEGVNWANYWPAIFAALFGLLLFNVHLLLSLSEHDSGQQMQLTNAMLVVQSRGKSYALLATTIATPWLALVIVQAPVLLAPALSISFFCFVAPVCALMVLAALFRFLPAPINWQAREWIESAHRALFETRHWQLLAPALGVLIVVASLVIGVTSRGQTAVQQSDANVSIVAVDRREVETTITRLKSFSGAQSVRWIGMFVPDSAEDKRAVLRELASQFPRITPVQSEAPTDLREQIDAMQESLKRIAILASKDKNLADAADQFRRSLALLSASDRDQPITQLENRLFGGFNRLADRAAQLASLAPIDIDTLPVELQKLFGDGGGPFRIEVDAAPGTSNDHLAVALDQAGFNVSHPAVMQTRLEAKKLRSILQVISLAISFVLLTLIFTFRDPKRWLSLVLLTAAAIVVAFAVNTLWHPDFNLQWLISFVALISCFGGILHVAMERYETNAASVIETFMLPSIALAIVSAFYALDVQVVSKEAMPFMICIFLLALLVSLFHHHSSAAQKDEEQLP